MRRAPALLLALLLAAPAAAQPALGTWQARIQPEDRVRLAGLWRAWTSALNNAASQAPALAALGPVATPPLEPLPGTPEARAGHPLPGPGAYRCRTIRIGHREDGWSRDGTSPLAIGDWGSCRVTAGNLLVTESGAQRLSGQLWSDDDRMVMLGALHLAAEGGRRRYGDDHERDLAGILRPLGPGHWRLELPWPRWQSRLMLVEMKAP
jgi:hypothetical protein